MKKLSLLLLLLMVGCTFLPPLPPVERITKSKVQNPFFYIPPENLKDFQARHWILLAESQGRNWFYAPYSVNEDEDGIVSFDAYIAPRVNHPAINQFNATITGPFLQKIDCFGNFQWSEIFYADQLPPQESYVNPQNPTMEYGWIKIRPKSAMAYIRARICGRKFLDDKNINYFLYQEGRMPAVQVRPAPIPRTPTTPLGALMAEQFYKPYPPVDLGTGPGSSPQKPPVFYEVINNEIFVVDDKKNIREMKISSYLLDKEFPKLADYVFRANCGEKKLSFTPAGKPVIFKDLGATPDSLENVAFNRVCGDHGEYMKIISQKGAR